MRRKKSRARVIAALALTLILFVTWIALPIKYQRWLEPTAFAAAKTFTVDTGSDGSDVNPGDGICNSIPGGPHAACARLFKSRTPTSAKTPSTSTWPAEECELWPRSRHSQRLLTR